MFTARGRVGSEGVRTITSMTRALLPSSVPRRRNLRAGGVSLASAQLLTALPAYAQAADAGTPAATVVSLLSLTLTAGAIGWTLRAHRRARDNANQLQQCRAEAHALRSLLDVWQWRSDAQHRLTEWRAPAASPGGPVLRPGARLWDVFTLSNGSGAPLQERLEQASPLPGLRVTVAASGPGTAASFVLQAQPVLDAEGRFAGYVGTARLVQDGVTTLLTDVLQALPSPVFRIGLPRRGQPPRLLKYNCASSPWLGERSHGGDAQWDDLLGGMPPAVRSVFEGALAHPVDIPIDVPGGWTLRLHRLPCPGTQDEEVLAIFQRMDASPARIDPAADDAESFSYTVSHDLRAPIRVVEGFTKIVKEDYGHAIDRIGNDHLDRVLAAAARMNSMIDSLLALSQLSSRPLSRQPVNLSMLANYIIDDLRRQSPEREVEVFIEPGLQTHGDATLLRVVLENLLGNAWKYTGKCRVGRIWFERSEHEGRPAITVRDNGAGFDMRFADRLFGVFQRLHSANDFQGTGIGLASVRRIVRRHGGDIWAEAEVDRGARFQFWLGS